MTSQGAVLDPGAENDSFPAYACCKQGLGSLLVFPMEPLEICLNMTAHVSHYVLSCQLSTGPLFTGLQDHPRLSP